MHVFTVLCEAGGKGGARGLAEEEGSASGSGLKICVTGRITEMAAEKTRALLPERRRAVLSRLLIVETHRKD